MSVGRAFCLVVGLITGWSVPAFAQQPTFAAGIPLGIIASTNLTELSGVVASRRNPGVLWTHNDGSRDRVFAIGTNGQLFATYEINENIDDFEDLVMGPGPLPHLDYLYAGDIGDNLFTRPTFEIYRMPEPSAYPYQAAAPESDSFKLVERFSFAYPDGSYDTEAFFCDPRTGDLYFATKQPLSRIYRAERAQLQTSLVITCSFVRTMFFSEPSAATMSPDGSEILFRQESYANLWQRGAEQAIGDALAGPAYGIPVIGRPQEPNGEALAYHPTGLGYYTLSEGVNQPIYFFAKTEGFVPPQPTVLLAPASEWKFLDNGSNQGTTWRQPSFSDAFWASGPGQLGYGNGDEQTLISYGGNQSLKHITTYFRTRFNVADPAAIEQLTLSTVFDDGIAIYINGTEVLRRNLTANAGYTSLATAAGSDFENLWQTFVITNDVLVAGVNVICAEVHRRTQTEGDLSFDLQLEAVVGESPIEFVSAPVHLPNGAWVLGVRGPAGGTLFLEASSNLTDWSDVATFVLPQSGMGSVTNGPSAVSPRFFRVRQ